MAARPNIVVQLSRRASVDEFRAGVGNALGVVTLGPETDASWKMAGIDAFYLSLTRAERWGSRPIPEHSVAVLKTTAADQNAGYPPFIVTGFLLSNGDPDTA